jgi:hypothetical protein
MRVTSGCKNNAFPSQNSRVSRMSVIYHVGFTLIPLVYMCRWCYVVLRICTCALGTWNESKISHFHFSTHDTCVFRMWTSHVTCNFIFTSLDKLSACVVSYWYTLHIACVCENDLISLASHTKLPSLHMPCMNVICECMFRTHHPKNIPIHLEWHSRGVVHVVSSCIFYTIFLLENFQVVTIGVPCLSMQCKWPALSR